MPEDTEKSIDERIEETLLEQAVKIEMEAIPLTNAWDCHRPEHEGINDENIKEHVEECLGEMLNAYIEDDRNYVLDGAVISCDQMTDKAVYVQFTEEGSRISIDGEKTILSDYKKPANIGPERYNPEWEEYEIPLPVGKKNIRKLHAALGNSQSSNGIRFATVADRSYLREEEETIEPKSDTNSNGMKVTGVGIKSLSTTIKEKKVSIVSCGNCKKLEEEDIKKIAENWRDVYKYGTCYALMQLASSWNNPYCMESVVGGCKGEDMLSSSGVNTVDNSLEYETCVLEHHRPMKFSTLKGEKEGLTMMSTLLCSGKGGIITIEASGQIHFKIPVLILDGWLTLYDCPTVVGEGRSVPRHPDAFIWDWATPGDLGVGESKKSEDWFETVSPVHNEIANVNKGSFEVQKTNNNLYIDGEGRYWVAVGPNVVNPEHSTKKTNQSIDSSEVYYGTKLDIVIEREEDGEIFYIPAVNGETKEHSYPDGLYQTGIPFDETRPEYKESAGNTVEFMGYNITEKIYDGEVESKSSINITNDYKLIKIIVYDGIYNYK